MEPQLIIGALKATTSPGDQSEATNYLNNVSSMIGFPSILVEIVRNSNQEISLRQAAVIFLKNFISRAWSVDDLDKEKITPISEQDKVNLRSQIVVLIVESPEPIRIQLCVCIQSMLRHDFPEKWSTQTGESIVDEIVRLLSSNQAEKYLAGLYITYRLTKIYEYKRQIDKKPFVQAMQQILPILFGMFNHLLPVVTQESCLFQKLILKIFYCLVQFSLSPDLFTSESFRGWFETFVTVINREIPAEINQYDNDEKEATVYWKCKKWAMKIIDRVFERYGSKGHVEKQYEQFAEYYTTNLASHAITSVMHILSQHAANVYVSERVLYLSISHLAEALSHGQVWKTVKDHLMGMFETVLFPLMRHTDDDEELWADDPEVYLREKMDCWEELHSPTSAAIKFINAATKRKGVLQPILTFVIGKLDDQASNSRDVDGALHVIAALAEFLCGDKRYKKDVEKLLYVHVRPRINSPDQFIRARALRVINEAGGAPIKTRDFLNELTELITQRLQDPNEQLPVKFEAALAIQSLINNQENIHAFIRPRIRELVTEVLRLLTHVQLEDLPIVVETLIENFEEDVIPVAESIVSELIKVFDHLTTVEGEDETTDENGITVMGVLSTLQTILGLVEDHAEIVTRVEPMVHQLILRILDAFATDYFDECTGLIENLITTKISPQMWDVFDKLEEVFKIEGSMFFCDAMPCFYKFIVTDTSQFLSKPERVVKLLHMCSQVMQDTECGDDIRAGAVKILEVLLTQCQGRLDNYIGDIIVLLMQYFAQSQENFEEFETQVAVTLVSAFVCNPQQFLTTIAHIEPHRERNFAWLFDRIFKSYRYFNGIHDCAMALHGCIMAIRLPIENRPPNFVNIEETLTMFMSLFENITRCRTAIAENNKSDSEDEDSSDDEDANDSKRNIEMDLNEADREYVSRLNRLENESDSDDSEARHSFVERTDLEDYETVFDGEEAKVNVFDQFLNLLEDLSRTDPQYYQGLAIHHVPADKKEEFEELIALCRREQQHFRSRQVEQSGGCEFNSLEIPGNFNFG